jgi:spore maturation protein CgeB
MNIFYAAPDTPHQGCLENSKLWRANLYSPLRDLGHDIVEFQYDYGPANYHLDPGIDEHREFINRNRPRFSEELVRQVKQAHQLRPIDLFFSYFYSSYVDPDAIREIGRLGIVTVNWYCNASYQFHLVEEIAPAFHYCLVPEKFRLADYQRVGANAIYCQEAANPQIYRPHNVPREFEVTFVGQRYGNRPELLGRLVQAGVDTRAWGPHWNEANLHNRIGRSFVKRLECWVKRRPYAPVISIPRECCGGPLSDDELIRMYSRSRISLGFSAVAHFPKDGSPPIKQVRLRDFEATMSGAFYLVEQFDELAEFFEPDLEIVFFRDADELIDKAKYFLRHESHRERIRQAGLQRARQEHTWHHRFKSVFEKIGLPAHGSAGQAA